MYQKIFASLILSLAVVTPVAVAEIEPAAQEPAARATLQTPAAAMCSTPAEPVVGLPLGEASPTLQAVTSVCTATCWDGSQRTCQGQSCSATDSSCPNQRGYCWSDAEGYKYCPQCPCPSTVPCSQYDGQACYPAGARVTCVDGGLCLTCVCSTGAGAQALQPGNNIWLCP